jgi:hypothetical protein
MRPRLACRGTAIASPSENTSGGLILAAAMVFRPTTLASSILVWRSEEVKPATAATVASGESSSKITAPRAGSRSTTLVAAWRSNIFQFSVAAKTRDISYKMKALTASCNCLLSWDACCVRRSASSAAACRLRAFVTCFQTHSARMMAITPMAILARKADRYAKH